MEVLKQLKIKPKNKALYEEAFCHTSYANEQGLKTNYERLEFLGDAVFDLVISEYLFKSMQLEEGEMSKLRARYVCESALAGFALELNFNQAVKVGKGEQAHGGNFREGILADVFEAFIGALYLDLGYYQVRSFIKRMIIPLIEDETKTFFIDYKTILQEQMQICSREILYEVVKQIGPAHDRKFTVRVKINGLNYGEGTASSKKKAEQAAAKKALSKKVVG